MIKSRHVTLEFRYCDVYYFKIKTMFSSGDEDDKVYKLIKDLVQFSKSGPQSLVSALA